MSAKREERQEGQRQKEQGQTEAAEEQKQEDIVHQAWKGPA